MIHQDGHLMTETELRVLIKGTKSASTTVSGSVDTAGQGTTISCSDGGTTFICQVSNMANGDNNVTVTATDAAGNTKTATTKLRQVVGDGCFGHGGNPIVTDALMALKMVVGLTASDKVHGDVNLNGKVDSGDALMILKKSSAWRRFKTPSAPPPP